MNLRRTRAKLRRRKDLARSPGRLLVDRVAGQLYIDLGGDHRDTVFLAGSARAGTTWVSDVVNHNRDYRYVFEPFHPNRLRITESFKPRQYLRPDDRDPAYLKPADEILSGRIRSIWTDKYNRAHLPRKRLIKEVRGNLLLGWMHRNFPGMPIVLVLRHPCAVVSSQLKLPWNWHTDPDVFLSQDALMKDHLEPFREELTRATDPFERHVFVWCVENLVPLRQFERDDIHLAFYEHLVTEPRLGFERMFSFLGRPFDEAALARVGRPSAVSRSDSPVVMGTSSVDGWRREVTAEQVERALRILAMFGLERVYGRDPMPAVTDPGTLLRAAG